MQLSPHFTLGELIVTSTGMDNTPTPRALLRLRHLAANLEEVRRIGGNKPLVVTSAYRNVRVNKAVGGVPNSDHAKGDAADIRHPTLSSHDFAILIRDSGIKFDQLILETSRNIVHVSFAPRMRQQVLTQRKGAGTPIEQGIRE